MKTLAASAALFALVLAAHDLFARLPDREELGPRETPIRFEPVELGAAELAPFRVAGAWSVTSDDRRFGGVSALATHANGFVAISDSGSVLRFPKPTEGAASVHIDELPAGPGSPRFKPNRDSEDLARDPAGRGWWIAFESTNELWLYDREFRRPLQRVAIPGRGLTPNKGIEGLTSLGHALIAAPETGGRLLRLDRNGWSELQLDSHRRTSDLVALDERTLLIIHRQLTPFGIRNAIAAVRKRGGRWYTSWRKPLPLERFDNVEAIAAERRAGGYRLWLMTDNGFNPRLRTLLIALDLAASDD